MLTNTTLSGERRRKLIAAIASVDGSRFVSVTWRKDDGTVRRAVVNPRDFTGVKGDAAAPSAQRAVATRKITNPDLWNVRDHSAKPARWISIRCRGEIEIKQGGETISVDLG